MFDRDKYVEEQLQTFYAKLTDSEKALGVMLIGHQDAITLYVSMLNHCASHCADTRAKVPQHQEVFMRQLMRVDSTVSPYLVSTQERFQEITQMVYDMTVEINARIVLEESQPPTATVQ